jgi:hypothetical protein
MPSQRRENYTGAQPFVEGAKGRELLPMRREYLPVLFGADRKVNGVKKKYYYIADVESVPRIQEEGITADEGVIPIFIVNRGKMRDVLNTAGYIAANQLFLGEYALFEIMEAGITGEIVPHGVSGKTAPFQKIITQERIARDHIKFINCFTTTFSV